MQKLCSPNAVKGMVYLFHTYENRQSVQAFDDTADDYGDAFTSAERAALAEGKTIARGTALVTCMVTATRCQIGARN